MKLLEQARELLNYVKIVVDADRGDFLRDGDLILFLEAVIPVLQEHEKRQELIRAFNAANKPGQIIAVPDEHGERRTLAIYEQAVKLYQYAPSSGDTIVSGNFNTEGRVRWAVDRASEILAEVEKRA